MDAIPYHARSARVSVRNVGDFIYDFREETVVFNTQLYNSCQAPASCEWCDDHRHKAHSRVRQFWIPI